MVGIHPNTVRLYEKAGFLSKAARSDSGYRLFTALQKEELILAYLALRGQWPGPAIRKSALSLVRFCAAGDHASALRLAREHLRLVRHELRLAEEAAEYLERWAAGRMETARSLPCSIREAARKLEVTADALRNWERDGLVRPHRNPRNRYREYGSREISRLKVIRTLTRAGYSHMAVLRMLRRLDSGETSGLRAALDTPASDEDVITAADRWLSTLSDQADRARLLLRQVRKIMRNASTP